MNLSDPQFSWTNPPAEYSLDNDVLVAVTGDQTDFWRETFYGFWRDNGHFFGRPVDGDFSVEVTVSGDYETLYDQAGLMLRLSETNWIKAGIEFTDGRMYFSVVVTNDASDWSLVEVPISPDGIRLRLTRHAEAVRVQYFNILDGDWKPVRLAYFPISARVDVGVMCCSPQRAGFKASFSDFSLGPPIDRDLHT